MKVNFNHPTAPNNNVKTSARNVGFRSLSIKCESNPLKFHDSSFYRDWPALNATKRAVQKFFPKGAIIIGGSGEEVLSLLSLFKQPNNYSYLGIDVAKAPVKFAQRKVFSVFSGWPDDFLIKPEGRISRAELSLKKKFLNVFEQARKPDYEINNSEYYYWKQRDSNFEESFFKLKDEYSSKANFAQMNINQISHVPTSGEPVAAILFRNAAYHDLENHLPELIEGRINSISQNLNRQKKADSLIEVIYNKLSMNGVFSLGNCSRDYFYVADNFTPASNLQKISDLSSFQKNLNNYKKAVASQDIFDSSQRDSLREKARIGDIQICKKSPIQLALERDSRFKPIAYSVISLESSPIFETRSFPVVWQKVK